VSRLVCIALGESASGVSYSISAPPRSPRPRLAPAASAESARARDWHISPVVAPDDLARATCRARHSRIANGCRISIDEGDDSDRDGNGTWLRGAGAAVQSNAALRPLAAASGRQRGVDGVQHRASLTCWHRLCIEPPGPTIFAARRLMPVCHVWSCPLPLPASRYALTARIRARMVLRISTADSVGHGLSLHVRGTSALWIFQYRDRATKKTRSMSLGPAKGGPSAEYHRGSRRSSALSRLPARRHGQSPQRARWQDFRRPTAVQGGNKFGSDCLFHRPR
jgi:hypothetical protein